MFCWEDIQDNWFKSKKVIDSESHLDHQLCPCNPKWPRIKPYFYNLFFFFFLPLAGVKGWRVNWTEEQTECNLDLKTPREWEYITPYWQIMTWLLQSLKQPAPKEKVELHRDDKLEF